MPSVEPFTDNQKRTGRYKNNDEKTNTSAFIGKEYILLEEITILNRGTVKIDGVLWSCISANLDENIPAGTVVIVQEIKGNKLIVKPKN